MSLYAWWPQISQTFSPISPFSASAFHLQIHGRVDLATRAGLVTGLDRGELAQDVVLQEDRRVVHELHHLHLYHHRVPHLRGLLHRPQGRDPGERHPRHGQTTPQERQLLKQLGQSHFPHRTHRIHYLILCPFSHLISPLSQSLYVFNVNMSTLTVHNLCLSPQIYKRLFLRSELFISLSFG